MLDPSIDSLLEKVNSKYMLVTVAAKRARNMQDTGDYRMEKYVSHKNVGKSLEEIHSSTIIAVDSDDVDEDLYEGENAVNQDVDDDIVKQEKQG